MSGYLPNPPRERLTREQALGAVLAVVAALLSALAAIAGSRAAPALLQWADLGLSPAGFIMWILAGAQLIQRDSAPDDLTIPRRTPRSRRLLALFLFLLGAAILAAPFVFAS